MRTLERTVGTICRKIAKRIVSDPDFKSFSVKAQNLEELLGPKKFTKENLEKQDEVGLVNGLAWTSVGGELLPIEVAVMEGTGKIQLTGSLGDVMKESASAALTCIRTVRSSSASHRIFMRKRTSTFTRRRAPCRRTVPRRASQWRLRSPRRCVKFRYFTVSR